MDAIPSQNRNITQEHKEEAARLLSIWEKTRDARKNLGLHTQGAFGAEYKIGNQAAVGFFLNGKAALSLKAAKGFAKGLGCKISDFSPRLATLETAWPFELVDQDLYNRLTPAQQHQAQIRMADEIKAILDEQAHRTNGTVAWVSP